jgi:uncharacterized protein (TIGR03437 family)
VKTRQSRKNRLRWTALCVLAPAWLLPAQDTGVMTRISTTAPDALFHVDGQPFRGAAVFTWPAGSQHTLDIDPLSSGSAFVKTQYKFQHWSTPAGPLGSPSPTVTIIADPGIPWYNADLTIQYAVTLVFYDCGGQTVCASPGKVWVNGTAYTANTDVWTDGGTTVTVQAEPASGYVFAGWVQGAFPSIYTFQLTQPVELYPIFAPARPMQLLTVPDKLQVLADRAPLTAPATLQWGLNTVHTLSVVSPQADLNGRWWLFRSWSDGGALTHTYQMQPGVAAASVTAQFVRAVAVALASNPPGFALIVDGKASISQSLFWGPGDTHIVAAPATADDGSGAPWVFRAWSNGAGNPQTITVTDDQANTGIRLTALYDQMSRIHIESVPLGLLLSVDGANCRTPCDVQRTPGSTVQITAPASIPVADGVRLDLAGWDGYNGRAMEALAGVQKVTARYQTSYRLALRTLPADGGTWRVAPSSADGFVPAGSVSIEYDPTSAMKFRSWALDLSGNVNPATFLMDGPHTVEALLDAAPAPPAPPRVSNAAGDTPGTSVAAGSVASLFGTQLTEATAQAQTDPLPQSLGGVSLECAGRLFSLLYVSPGQINFQAPSDLPAGDYQLQVHRPNSAALRASFSIARNAPGLLAATHQDGSAITTDAPAAKGELIVLLGTGFGPFTPAPLDGFRIPATPAFAVTDAVDVLIGGRDLTPVSALAVPGAVGVAAVQVKIPDDLDVSAPLTVSARSGGVTSNSLPLPVK